MTSPAAFTDADNWTGGFYELAIELGERDGDRLGRALSGVWHAAGVRGCYGSRNRQPAEQQAVPCTLESLDRFVHLRGVVRLPGGARVVCGAVTVREEQGPDWLVFYLPVGALGRVDPRVGAFPFGDDGGTCSIAWRRPIDEWLAGVGADLYSVVEYRLGLIGFEASGEFYAAKLSRGLQPPRYLGYLIPSDAGLRYEPASQ